MRLVILTTLQAIILFFIIWSYSNLAPLQSLLLAISLSLPMLLFVKKRKEERSEIRDEKLKPLFRKVLIFSLILSLTFPFSFNYLLESSKPKAPKEKFDAEVLLAVGRFLLMVATYMFTPLVFALILAHSYGYNWRILRGAEGRRYFGQIYVLFFIVMLISVMVVATVRSSHRYQIEGRILELLVAELALFAISVFLITFLLRKNGYGWRNLPELIAYASSLDWKEFAKDRKARLAQNVLLGFIMYLILAFMLADFVLRGELLEFFIVVAKIFAVLGTIFLPLWLAVALYTRRMR